ncbi:hypothetical protein BDZ97DRAFT_1755750 [Flammula alnicola]|nr:hypothetical protein BDZ97DRAFT_1755750 [Flammula alnicola]
MSGQQLPFGSCNLCPLKNAFSLFNPSYSTFQQDGGIGILLETRNLDKGNAVNPPTNYLAAPQQLSAMGQVEGHISRSLVAEDIFPGHDTPDPQQFYGIKFLVSIFASSSPDQASHSKNSMVGAAEE